MNSATKTNTNGAETMKKQITWTTGNGKAATVTVELVTERYIGHDDYLGDLTKPCADIRVSANIDGMGTVGHNYRRIDNHPQGVAAMCGKLGIMECNSARIDAAIAECKATPEYRAQAERERLANAEEAEYQAGRNRIMQAMSR